MNIQIIKRKDGIVYKACIGSSKFRQTKTFRRKIDAEKWISTLHCDPNGTKTLPKEYLNFGKLFEFFQSGYAEIHQELSTRQREKEIHQKSLLPYFGSKDARSLTRKDIQQYLYYEVKLGNRSNSTINKHFQVIHKVFAWAVKNGLLDLNPAHGVTKLPMKDTVYGPNYKFLEGEELVQALARMREDYPREFPVVFTAACTGLRLGEVCSLLRKDFYDQTSNPLLAVRRTYCPQSKRFKDTTKGGNDRMIPISDQLRGYLKSFADGKTASDFLLLESEAEAIQTWRNVRVKWRRAQKRCGIEPRSFHALRHTFATRFLSFGGNPFALQRILGHSNAKITDKYSHFSQALVEGSRNIVQYPALPS